MSKGNKEEQKWLLGESLNQYDRSLKEELNKVEKRNREQNHKISALINAFDDDYIKKEEENTNISLDYSKEGIVIVDDIKGNTLVNNVKDSNKELVLNGDIDTQGINNVTLEGTVDNGKVDVSLEGNTEINLSKTKDPIMITHKFDDINSNNGKLQTTVNGTTTVNNSPGKVDIKEITGDTLINHVSNGAKELTLNGDIDTSGYNNVTLTEGTDGGKVDIALEGNTMVNVCDQEEPIAITKNYTVENSGNHIALQGEYDGKCRPNIYGNTLVNLALAKDAYSCKNGIAQNNRINLAYNLKTGTTYTLIRTISEFSGGVIQEAINFYDMSFYTDGTQSQDHNCQYRGNGQYVSKFTPTKDVIYMDIIIGMDNIDKDNGVYPTITISDYMILEGDYTDKPIPDCFTGMKSSFEDKYIPENLYKFSSRDDFYLLDNNATLDGEYITMTANGNYQNAMLKPLGAIKPSTTYTVVVDVVENTLNSVLYVTNNSNNVQLPSTQTAIQINAGKTGIFTYTVTTSNDLSGYTRCLVNYLDNTNTTGSIKYRIMVVEGDYTKYDFTNYDSTKSGKYKVDYKVTGKNKCPRCTTTSTSGNGVTFMYDATTQTFSYSGTATNTSTFLSIPCPNLKLLKDKSYIFNVDNPLTNFSLQATELGVGYNCNLPPGQSATPIVNLDKFTSNSIMLYSQNLTIGQSYSGTFKVQIEEGTKATTYEPYKEYSKTLYLNSPLLINDLILDGGNKIQHAHRFKQLILNGSEAGWVDSGRELDNTVLYAITLNDVKRVSSTGEVSNLLCDKFTTIPASTANGTWGVDKEGISINTEGAMHIRIAKSKLSKVSLNGFKTWLDANPIKIVYPLKSSIYETILTNDNFILDSYANGHLDVDSIVPIDKVVFQSYGTSLKYLSPNTEYTIQFESDSNGKLDALALNSSDVIGNLNIVKGINKFNITTSDEITINYLWTTGIGFNMSKIVVTPKVDGDFGYFKEMKSVGQNDVDGHKIEILSQNKNLWVAEMVRKQKNGQKPSYTKNNNIITYTEIGDYGIYVPIKVKKGETLRISGTIKNVRNIRIFKASDDFKGIGLYNMEYYGKEIEVSPKYEYTFTEDGEYHIRIWIQNTGEAILTNFLAEISFTNTAYIEGKSNKKEILMNEPLRGLPDGVRDKYVLIDGKWYIERNTTKIILDGINILCAGTKNTNLVNTLRCSFDIQGYKCATVGFGICDSMPYIQHNNDDKEHIRLDGTIPLANIVTWIKTSKLSGSSITDVDKYLQQNPIKVICQLAQPTYEPIDYNPFEVYTDVTHISNNSIIPCNMVIKNSGYNCILKPSTLYTIAIDTNKSGTIGMNLGGAKGTTSNNVTTITTPATLTDNTLRLYGKGIKASGVRLLEGDKTNWIPSHFEGMKSCFEDRLQDDGKYKMEILCNNKNLFSIKDIASKSAGVGGKIDILTDKMIQFTSTQDTYTQVFIVLKLKPFTKYKLSAELQLMQLYTFYGRTDVWDSNKYFADIGNLDGSSLVLKTKEFVTDKSGIITIRPSNEQRIGTNIAKNIIVEEGASDGNYVPQVSNKIQFLLNEPLRRVGNVKDKVYVKEDKIIVERNCTSVTFDGSDDEKWIKDALTNNYTDGSFIATYKTSNMKPNTQVFIGGVVDNLPNLSMNMNIYSSKTLNMNCYSSGWSQHYICLKNVSTLEQFRQWLQANPITVVYQLQTPYYEEIEYSNNRLTLNSYDNSTLFYDTNIPVSNTSFKPLWEELVYVKNSTTYYIQFNAIGSGNVVVNLGGTELSATITEGYNKIEITTPNKSTNLLTIDGQGIKISKVVVSEVLCGGYYKGLQSCFEEHMENGKYVCVVRGISLDGSKVNGIKFHLNEPLRGIGDIKDRLCIKDNKLMVERNCSREIFDNTQEYRELSEMSLDNTIVFRRNKTIDAKDYANHISDKIPSNVDTLSKVDIEGTYIFNNTIRIRISRNKLSTQDLAGFKKYLQQNPITVVYQLATPVYEEVTNEYGLPIILEGYENGIVYVDSAVTPTTSIKYTSNNTVPTTLSNVDNLNTTTQDDINNNIVTYMMDIDMMLTEMEMEDNASTMSLSDSNDNNQKHNRSSNNILDRMNEEDRIKYQDNTTKMLEKVIKGKSLTNEENINRIDLYLSEGKIREEQSNYLKELLKGGE